MQTCKELRLVCLTTHLPIDYNNHSSLPITQNIVIPSGTYVELTFDRWNPDSKMYRVKAWRGMPKEYKELVNYGVIITHAQVKGKCN